MVARFYAGGLIIAANYADFDVMKFGARQHEADERGGRGGGGRV